VLARWSGWGAVPAVFDPQAADHARFGWARAELADLLDERELAAATRSTLNAHYTDLALVRAIWSGLGQLGFRQGRVLEPGCGSGNFLAAAPEGAGLVGVEVEPVTAGIAGLLYPQARIRVESFAQTRAPEGSFDLVVGNVPFGQVALSDRAHNLGGHSIHNHFIIKSLRLTRPGGLVAVLTSRYTMDARNPAARREMAALADLVTAVRLPSGAHQRAAGTQVVTDLLVLRRREPGREPDPAGWEQSRPTALPGGEAHLNEYFLANPGQVLGQPAVSGGMSNDHDLAVVGDRDAAGALAAALQRAAEQALERGLAYTPGPPAGQPRPVALVEAGPRRPDGYLRALPDGSFTVEVDGAAQPHPVPARQAGELRALLRLRDTVVQLLEAEAASVDDTEDIDRLRQRLDHGYDAYVRAYGPINRFSWRRTGRVDPDTGQERLARVRPGQGGFRCDPYANVVYALEHFDPVTQHAAKADIFTQRVIAPRPARLGADTPADALAICLDTHGQVRLDVVARLLGADQEQARRALGELVFDDPGTGRLVPAAEYLSGNVRVKLAQARPAAGDDPRYGANVAALERVLPRDLAPEEIDARLGAAWIEARWVQQFLRETLQDPQLQVEHPGGSTWTVKSQHRHGVLSSTWWGTGRYPAPDVAEALLMQRQIRIYDPHPDDQSRRVFNPNETLAAQEKAAELAERFGQWVWEQPHRAETLARVYNDTFNAIVLRRYDGSQLSLPGLALTFGPHAHQRAAVARMIAEPAVGLFHEVGAGKTATMVMGAMELRRLGLVGKPAVVVPNHMLEQFTREWLQLYPRARVLAAGREDLAGERRRLFVARCATGDWDAVVMTRSAFERIPMSPAAQKAYLDREVAQIDAQLQRARADGQRLSLKQLERMKLQAEQRIARKLEGVKDPGISFEQTGIDYLIVDEAHAYKNLRTTSNIPGMAVDGSMRATDLHMKIEYLRGRRERVATFATATPIANSMGEAYTMQRFLRPDLLTGAGITDFDVWAATFGQTVAAIEVAPDGGIQIKSRFAKFVNVPELLRMWHVSADIKTAEDLQLPVPELVAREPDGKREPESVVVPASSELGAFLDELAGRAEQVRARQVDPTDDNMLKITTEGRAAALDLRLVGRHTSEPGKITAAADRIAGLWRLHAGTVYPGMDGRPHPVPGALQLVFSDLGTPKPGGQWSVYRQLREALASRGLPAQKVRFVHEARNDREKAQLFAACRNGQVAVLVGSTERMGVGTNVQARAIAEHDLDCPWRPADVQQRTGRIRRQGNHNDQVRVLRYITEGSFDAYLWQTVQRKAQFIAQVMRGRLDVREIEDIGEAALSYQEVKALATGNPLLLDQAQAQAELTRLERLERAHRRNWTSLRSTIAHHEHAVERLRTLVGDIDTAIARRIDTTGDRFTMTIGQTRWDKRAGATDHLRTVLAAMLDELPDRATGQVAELGGFTVAATVHRDRTLADIGLRLVDVPGSAFTVSTTDLAKGALVTRLEKRLTGLEHDRKAALSRISATETEASRARAELEAPFRQREQLAAARARLHELDEQIKATTTPEPAAEQPDTAETPPREVEELPEPLHEVGRAQREAMHRYQRAEADAEHAWQSLADAVATQGNGHTRRPVPAATTAAVPLPPPRYAAASGPPAGNNGAHPAATARTAAAAPTTSPSTDQQRRPEAAGEYAAEAPPARSATPPRSRSSSRS